MAGHFEALTFIKAVGIGAPNPEAQVGFASPF